MKASQETKNTVNQFQLSGYKFPTNINSNKQSKEDDEIQNKESSVSSQYSDKWDIPQL